MAELEDFSIKVYENEEEQRLVDKERARGKEKTAKEAGRRKSGHWKKRPTRRELTNYKRTF